MKEVIEFTAALQLAVKSLQFYNADHPRAVDAINVLEKTVPPMLASRLRLTISGSQGSLVIDGQPLASAPPQARVLSAELEKRGIGGIVLVQGVTRRELTVLVRLLAMKPEQIASFGGADEILRREEVTHFRLSHVRYEAVTEGEEVVWSNAIRRGDSESGTDSEASLPALLQKFLLSRTGAVGGAGSGKGKGEGSGEGSGEGNGEGNGEPMMLVHPDEIAISLATALKMSPGEGAAPSLVRASELLKSSIAGLDPISQIALIISLDRLPEGTERDILKSAAAQILGASAGELGHGTEEQDAADVLRALTGSNDKLSLLRDRLTDMGISREQLDELLGVLTWEKLSVEEKLAGLMEGERIFEIPSDKLLRFVRDLLEEGRGDEVLRVLERYVKGLDHAAFFIRRNVCDALGVIASFIRRPGLPPQVEQLVGRSILNHCIRETDPRMKATLAESSSNLILMMIATGRADTALRVLEQLNTAFASLPAESQVRATAEALRQQFGTTEHAGEIIREVATCDSDRLTRSVLPLVTVLGDVLVPHVVEALASEEDRGKRGRFVRTLKTIGSPAFPFLIDALSSHTWFIVRNALNVLADIGTSDHVSDIGSTLQHDDPRVRRAAVRALHRLGGAQAEGLLISAINDKNAETQGEVFTALGAMKAQGAIPALAELARGKRLLSDAKLREAAIATLGQIGAAESVPVLSDILRPKGIFARDAAQIRIAAARALAGIDGKPARDALKSALASETDRATKETLAKIVGA